MAKPPSDRRPRGTAPDLPPPLPPLLLLYGPGTSPQPLRVGETGAVTLTVTSPARTVSCDKILLSVKVGSDADCLFQAAPAPSVAPSTWSAGTAQIVTGESLGLGAGSYATIKFWTDDPTAYAVYPLTLTLQGQTGTTPGAFPVIVTESAGTTSDPQSFTRNRGQVRITSGTPGFYLGSFVATAAAQGENPCTEFQRGVGIFFSWDSNGDNYALWRKGDSSAFWTGTAPPPTSFAAPTTDTTYFLVATATEVGTQTLYDSLTITIRDPALKPHSIVVAGQATLSGSLIATAGATVTHGLHTDTLTATGTTDIQGTLTTAGLTNSGGQRNAGGLTNTGGLGTDSLTSGSLHVTGTATLTSAAIAGGTATLQSASIAQASAAALSATGPVALIGRKVPRDFGTTYTAATDGFLVASIWPRSGVSSNNCWINLSVWWAGDPDDVLWVEISGGTPGGVDLRNTGMIPVAQGQTYSPTFHGEGPGIGVWWIPLGLSS